MSLQTRLKKIEAHVAAKTAQELADKPDMDAMFAAIPEAGQKELCGLLDQMGALPLLPNGDHDFAGKEWMWERIEAIVRPYLVFAQRDREAVR